MPIEMKWFTSAFLFLSVIAAAADTIDKEAILEVLRKFETEYEYPSGKTEKIKIVADLLEEPFRTDVGIVTPQELKELRFDKNDTAFGNLKALMKIDHDLVVVIHDTGFNGGFIAYLEKNSHEVILIQIMQEG